MRARHREPPEWRDAFVIASETIRYAAASAAAALDHALRTAIERAFPVVSKFDLIDYKVRILDQGHGTDAVIRVLIETADGEGSWFTVGVGHNIVEASWEALVDGVTYGLVRHEGAAR